MKKMILILVMILLASKAFAYSNEEVCDAIYKAEGSELAHTPYGIESVSCDGKKDCRRVCINTVRNNIVRWRNSESPISRLQFLANRYCPLNPVVWLKNVKWFLANGVSSG